MANHTASTAPAAVYAVHAEPAAAPEFEFTGALAWMLGEGAAPVAAVMAMVAEKASIVAPAGYEVFDGAAGFKCIKGKTSRAVVAKLEALGARRSFRKGGCWSVSEAVYEAACAIAFAPAAVGCSVCGLHQSQFGKRCPGYKVA